MLRDALVVALALLVGVVPPLLLGIFLRNLESRRREPWLALGGAFAWGALGAASLAIAAQTFLFGAPAPLLGGAAMLGLLVGAPVIEELAKAAGLVIVRDDDPEPEDGFLYGAAVGLGFAATENTVYVLSAFAAGGAGAAATTALFRAVAATSIHAAATAWAGYGLWQARRTGARGVFPFFLLGAILLHALYNGIATLEGPIALLGAVALAILAIRRVARRVRALDAR